MAREATLGQIVESTLAQPIMRGGTSAIRPSNADANLLLVTTAQKDQDNGVFSLDATGKISGSKFLSANGTNKVNLNGSLSMYVNATATFQITDYDSFRVYTVTASAGTVSRVNDTITYTAPAVAQAVTLTINGRAITINAIPLAPNQPTLTVTLSGGAGQTAVGYLTLSAFSITGSSATHQNTDWQIATDSAFTNVIASSLADATNLLFWQGNGLALNTTYYFRARQRSTDGGVSPYANTVTLTTAASYTISTEEFKATTSDRAAGDLVGYSVALSSDGTRAIVGAPMSTQSSLTNSGAAYVFLRTGLTWAQEAKLTATDKAASNFFGRATGISDDGTRVAISAPGNNSGATNKGAAYIFLRTGVTWAQEAKIAAADGSANDLFGDAGALAVDSTCTRVVVGVKAASVSGLTTAGAVYVYSRSGVTWTQEQKITEPTPGSTFLFGTSVDISADGATILVGASASNYVETGVSDQVFTTPGTYTFTVPVGVTAVSAVAVGAGGGEYHANSNNCYPGGGGALAYINNLAVTGGQTITVVVGAAGVSNNNSPTAGGNSSFGTMVAGGGGAAANGSVGIGGVVSGTNTAGFAGGAGVFGSSATQLAGSAGGYTAAGANGGQTGIGIYGTNGTAGTYGRGDDANYFAPAPANSVNGAVRVVWGNGKTYPSNAIISSVQGVAYAFTRSGVTWTNSATLKASVPTLSGQYGSAVSISGDATRLAVAAVNTPTGTGTGMVYVYQLVSTTWTEEAKLVGSSRVANDFMGKSISLNSDGSALAIGESNATASGTATAGSYYYYSRVSVTWTLSNKTAASDKVAAGLMGFSVDISDDGLRIISGSTGSSVSSVVTGAAYIERK